ncbi:MAG: hypothetical protein U9R27_02020 [Campylobacterota bacterium]|nr:hypothetical protein [Campylobacterota bacterium]
MKHLFKPDMMKTIILILSLMLLVKIGWFITEMTLLSATGVEYTKPSEIKSLYYKTRFAVQKLKQKKVVKKRPVSDINSFKLLAIYRSEDRIVITVSKAGKSSVLLRGDTIDGYVLDDATATEAIFLRDEKSHSIHLIEATENTGSKNSVKYIPERDSRRASIAEEISDAPEEKPQDEEIIREDDVTIIDKGLLDHYGKNIEDIWKNIGIKEVKEGNQIKGFRVNFVKRGSDFSKLGLRRGDLIKTINGQELNSYNSAFEIYKNIDVVENLTLTIKRGKEEMELNYEIN